MASSAGRRFGLNRFRGIRGSEHAVIRAAFAPLAILALWGDSSAVGATPPCCPADLNASGTVDAADLALLLGTYGSRDPGGDPSGDLDGDGVVQTSDVAILIDAWGACPDVPYDPGQRFGTYDVDVSESGSFTHTGVAVGDVDGDGDMDTLTVGTGADRLFVLRRECDGASAPPESYPMGSGPAAIALGDVNADGHPDAVAACLFSDDVVIRLGEADGTFGGAVAYPMGDWPAALLLVDLNGDERPDIITANVTGQSVVARLNNGRGGFGPIMPIAAGFAPKAIAAGDLDGDGDADLAVASANPDLVRTYANRGDGTFDAWIALPGAVEPASIVAADLDADGDIDLAAAFANLPSSPDVKVYRNTGEGLFPVVESFSVAANTRFIDVADVDGDRDVDLITGSALGITPLLNAGNTAFVPGALVSGGGDTAAVATADVDDDGDEDIVTAHLTSVSPSISYLMNDGAGGLGEVTRIQLGGHPYSGVAGDFDGDGDLDLAVGGSAYQAYGISVLRNLGRGAFELWQTYSEPTIAVSMSAADLDGDRDEDLIVLFLGGGFEIRWNDGAGDFAQATAFPLTIDSLALVAKDLDADGDVDLSLVTFSGGTVLVALNNGAGGFGPLASYPMGGMMQKSLVCEDMNGDGRPDLVASSGVVYNESKLMMRWNVGDGTFGPLVTVTMPTWINAAIAGDIDNDGDMDIVATNDHQVGGPGTIAVRLNDGTGTLGAATMYEALRYPHGAILRDVNADGRLDLLLCNEDLVTVRFGGEGGVFGEPYSYVTGRQPTTIIVGDFDSDGDPDIATTANSSDEVTIRWNRGG
jgi:hypothetical protein